VSGKTNAADEPSAEIRNVPLVVAAAQREIWVRYLKYQNFLNQILSNTVYFLFENIRKKYYLKYGLKKIIIIIIIFKYLTQILFT